MVIVLWIALAALLLSTATVFLFACFAVSSSEEFAEERELSQLRAHVVEGLAMHDFARDR